MPRLPPCQKVRHDKLNKHRVFNLLIYPDSESYNYEEILSKCISEFNEYAYIFHDSDYTETGELKKVHIHFVGRLQNPRSVHSLSKSIGLEENFFEVANSWKNSIRYLLHLDHNEKTAYTADKVYTNSDISRYLQNSEDELTQAETLLNYIFENNVVSISILMKFAIRSGLYSVLRRNSYMWCKIVQENKENAERYSHKSG